jgi:hypothetical protein
MAYLQVHNVRRWNIGFANRDQVDLNHVVNVIIAANISCKAFQVSLDDLNPFIDGCVLGGGLEGEIAPLKREYVRLKSSLKTLYSW